jgi:hypothetical protein
VKGARWVYPHSSHLENNTSSFSVVRRETVNRFENAPWFLVRFGAIVSPAWSDLAEMSIKGRQETNVFGHFDYKFDFCLVSGVVNSVELRGPEVECLFTYRRQ